VRSGNLPPLPYENASFDYIYSISVFTHFDKTSFVCWGEELSRVLRPGGLALLTLHGRHALSLFQGDGKMKLGNVDEQQFREALPSFDRDGFIWTPQVVLSQDVNAGQFGIAFIDERRLSEFFSSNLNSVEYRVGEIGGWQDLAIFERN
jgi:SAM-dependent methyltransferase